MTGVEELIDRLCPDGIEHRTLGEMARLVRGNGMPKSVLVDDGVGAIHYGQIYTRYGAWTESTFSFVTADAASRLAKADPGDVIITNTSENIEDVGKAVAWLGVHPIVTGGHATIIKHDLEPKYLSYWFQSPSFGRQKRALATGTKVIDVSARQLERVRVPVPPVEVQREIVRILDTFTELEAELEAELKGELEARRAQYRHFKGRLLAPSPSDPHIALKECTEYVRGLTYSKKDEVRDGGAGTLVLRSNNIDIGSNRLIFSDVRVVNESVRVRENQRLKRHDILLSAGSGSRAHVGKAAFIESDLTHTFGGFMAVVRADLRVDPRFLFHHLTSSRFGDYLDTAITSTTINNLTGAILGAFTIPLPAIAEQQGVADLLDDFEQLTSNLNMEIPAELAARRKQYEHYRDRLLTFKEIKG